MYSAQNALTSTVAATPQAGPASGGDDRVRRKVELHGLGVEEEIVRERRGCEHRGDEEFAGVVLPPVGQARHERQDRNQAQEHDKRRDGEDRRRMARGGVAKVIALGTAIVGRRVGLVVVRLRRIGTLLWAEPDPVGRGMVGRLCGDKEITTMLGQAERRGDEVGCYGEADPGQHAGRCGRGRGSGRLVVLREVVHGICARGGYVARAVPLKSKKGYHSGEDRMQVGRRGKAE